MQSPTISSLLVNLLVGALLFCFTSTHNDEHKSLCDEVVIKGEDLILCKEWKDSNARKAIILSKSRIGNYKVEFFCDVFSYTNNSITRVNGIYDKIDNCPVDFFIDFIDNSLSITDLDNDGLQEVTFLYAMACQGDVSPSKMKLMMLEGEDKYKLRGYRTNKATMSLNEQFGYGKYTVDNSFDQAPKAFLNYAIKQWDKFEVEE